MKYYFVYGILKTICKYLFNHIVIHNAWNDPDLEMTNLSA